MGRCNNNILSPKGHSNVNNMHRGFSDEAILVVKLNAEENMVTYLRVKHSGSAARWRRRAEHVNDELEIMKSHPYEIRLRKKK